MPDNLEQSACAAFQNHFQGEPTTLAKAPGRVELLGNHTDYNGGLVLAAAIDRFTVVVGKAIPERTARIWSSSVEQFDTFPIDNPPEGEPENWGRYARGVVWALGERFGPLGTGFEAAVVGNVPTGAGLSSSASLEAALGMFLIGLGIVGQEQGRAIGPDLDDQGRMELAHTLRRAENQFVGVASGLLDQFSSLFGKADHALFLDCLHLDRERLPLGDPVPAIVVCDSKTSRQLAEGKYNQRRSECERVVSYFQRHTPATAQTDPPRLLPPSVDSLRDVPLADLRAYWDRLDPVGRLRARHVLTENDRVRQGADALRRGDVEAFGRLMSASHVSSRDDFENSSPALDALVEIASTAPGHLGGKLSGAGWAGCTVHLVRAGQVEAFAAAIRENFARTHGIEPTIHLCRAADGAVTRSLRAVAP